MLVNYDKENNYKLSMIEATEIFNTTNALYWSTNQKYHYYVQTSDQCIANETIIS